MKATTNTLRPRSIFTGMGDHLTGPKPVSVDKLVRVIRNPQAMSLLSSDKACVAILVTGNNPAILQSCVDAANSVGLGTILVKEQPEIKGQTLIAYAPTPPTAASIKRAFLAPRLGL